ncbi:PP2C family protein-serine/threonine phosphatase [uncultured Streptomyces sp.]|uniref:PP2C family protein-serine/threonine phosphatase n=1 Tax=uncultured Streptomyces sp. TaxID=174707 RepID=UPI00261744C2|nr:SpoIIE family protein phosphatase [uncultured Streptomyces sp.]
MPSPLSADRPAPQPGGQLAVDTLIQNARRLRGDLDAIRQDAARTDEDDALLRWQRALCDLAERHLDDLGTRLGQLRDGITSDGVTAPAPAPRAQAPARPEPGAASGLAGSAEWNLLTDDVSWSPELYAVFGRDPAAGPLSLDELPYVLIPEDQPVLTAMVTGCLIDGKPLDGEFRVRRPDGRMSTLHMTGEPVLDADGCTASMWAVLRDVSALRDGQRQVAESRDSLTRRDHIARTERRMAVELHETVLPPWRGSLRLPGRGPGVLDVAAHYLPPRSGDLAGGDWYDALALPDGGTLLSVGDLAGRGIPATSGMAMMLGALRGMAVAGIEPAALMGHLNHLLGSTMPPALGSALCCRYDPATGVLSWAQAGHPAPLLFRAGEGHPLTPPDGVLLGAATGVRYEQENVTLLPGDLLVLHTDGLTRGGDRGASERLLALAPRLAEADSARECVRTVVAACGGTGRPDDACVLVARVGA